MFSVCLPSDALLQDLPSYLGFSYLGRGVSLQGCSSKVQPLLLTLDEGYLLRTARRLRPGAEGEWAGDRAAPSCHVLGLDGFAVHTQVRSGQFRRSVVPDSLQPHGQ